MGTLQTSLTWFFSALRTSPKLLKKMKIVILLFAVLATINAAAVQNAKAADKPAAVKAADIPKPAKVEDKLEAEDDLAEAQEDEGDDPASRSYCRRHPRRHVCRRQRHRRYCRRHPRRCRILRHRRYCRRHPHQRSCRRWRQRQLQHRQLLRKRLQRRRSYCRRH